MRHKHFLVLAIVLFSLSISHAEAIGGRGGGGGGGRGGGGRAAGGARSGGGSRAGNVQNRPGGARSGGMDRQAGAQFANRTVGTSSPSMSRADRGLPVQNRRPTQTAATRQMPSQAQIQQRAGQRAPQLNQTSAQNLRSSLPTRNTSNAREAAQATRQFRQNHPVAFNNLFDGDFYRNHNLDYGYYYPYGGVWGVPSWYDTASWIDLDSSDGGYSANYYDDSGSTTTLAPQEAYAYAPQQQNTYAAAPTQAPQVSGQQSNLLSLGVFAVGSAAAQAPYSNKVVQLSLSKDGYISGTYYNLATDQAYPIEGAVNTQTQQATFKLSNNPDSPVATTGLYNLTQDVANLQMYYPNGPQQPKVLVRLNK